VLLLWTKAAHGVDELRIPVGAGLAGLAVQTGEAIFIDDAYENEKYKEVLANGALKTDKITGYRSKAMMVIPFRNNEGEIMGCYQAVNKMTESRVFSDKDLEFLALAASYSGKSLESAMLYPVLKKPGKLTDEEFDIMKSHTDIGYNLLKNSNRHILKTAATVAYEHHEKWNGKGYPRGLKGEEIHIYGRITAIADVFDAL
jgi:hypothetical protein